MDNASQQNPKTGLPQPSDLFSQAEQCLSEDRFTEALSLYDQAAVLAPAEALLYERRAHALLAVEGPASAFVDVRTALSLARRQGLDLRPLSAWSQTLKEQLPAEVALQTASRAVDNCHRLLCWGASRAVEEICGSLLLCFDPYKPLFQFVLGVCKLSRQRWDQAVQDLGQAAKSLPTLWPAAYACGVALLRIDDLEGADRAFAHTQQMLDQGQTGFVYSAAEDFLAFVPGARFSARGLLFARARVLFDLGRPTESVSVLNQLIDREPDAADAFLSLASIYVSCEQFSLALAALDQAEQTLRPEDRTHEAEDPLPRIHKLRTQCASALAAKNEAGRS